LEVIAVLHYNNHDGVIHACVLKSLYFIKVNVLAPSSVYSNTTAMYTSSSSFVYLCFFSLYCDACYKSSVLRVGVKTFYNTQYNSILGLLITNTQNHSLSLNSG